MSTRAQQRILVVDDNSIFRETLAQGLRAHGHDVITAANGQRAFLMLRDWSRPIDWMYTRAALPGLIDGWILADEYHDTQASRAVVLSGPETRITKRGDIVLQQPTPGAVVEVIRQAIALTNEATPSTHAHFDEAQQAA